MANYLLGDIQGCDQALGLLLAKIDFSPSRDTLFCLGDLVNRGPSSLATLRRLMALGNSAQCLLGNHDLHFLALAHGLRPMCAHDSLQAVLQTAVTERAAIIDWVRHRPLAMLHQNGSEEVLMLHAGALPQWTAEQALSLAGEVEAALQAADYVDWLKNMYGNEPAQWHDDLRGNDRLRVIVNALTRLRFCSANGVMELQSKESAESPPAGFMPWFDVPGRASSNVTVAFGHWSRLGHINRPNLIALDTGCVWGGCLSAMRLAGAERELLQIDCAKLEGSLRPF